MPDRYESCLLIYFIALYGKIGSIASEEVVLNLVKSKFLSCLLHGVDAFALNKTELRSIDRY